MLLTPYVEERIENLRLCGGQRFSPAVLDNFANSNFVDLDQSFGEYNLSFQDPRALMFLSGEDAPLFEVDVGVDGRRFREVLGFCLGGFERRRHSGLLAARGGYLKAI